MVIGLVWTAIFILSAIALLIAWNHKEKNKAFWWVILLFTINAGLNLFWSELFFVNHRLGSAMLEAGFLEATVLALIGLNIRLYPTVAALLAPYAVWVMFAIYLNYNIWMMN
jgi:benzodiazapine receptor